MTDLRRHEGLTPKSLFTTNIHVIGCGGVGSHVAQLIARMGLGQTGLHLYDGDMVAEHNLPNQQFGHEHVGLHKVAALGMQIANWSGGLTPTTKHPAMVTEKRALAGLVFLCLDRMDARRNILETSVWGNPDIPLAIETRMDANYLVIHAVRPRSSEHRERWVEGWFPDTAAENLGGCGGHFAVPTTVNTCAALTVQLALLHYGDQTSGTHPNKVVMDMRRLQVRTEVWPE